MEELERWQRAFVDVLALGVAYPGKEKERLDEFLDYDVGPEQRPAVADYARKRLEDHARDEETWADRTDNDRLEDAFAALRSAGILALHGIGDAPSHGWEEVRERPDGPTQAVFYTRQDIEGALEGGGLQLVFGDLDGGDAADIRVGRRVAAALEAEGLDVDWNRTADHRIRLRSFRWRRRRNTRPPATPAGDPSMERKADGSLATSPQEAAKDTAPLRADPNTPPPALLAAGANLKRAGWTHVYAGLLTLLFSAFATLGSFGMCCPLLAVPLLYFAAAVNDLELSVDLKKGKRLPFGRNRVVLSVVLVAVALLSLNVLAVLAFPLFLGLVFDLMALRQLSTTEVKAWSTGPAEEHAER